MCEVPTPRERKPKPANQNMRRLLAHMIETGQPAVTVWGRRIVNTLDGQVINGASLNGLDIRGLVKSDFTDYPRTTYSVTPAGYALMGTARGEA